MIDRFVASRRPRWERLELLLAQASSRKGSRMSADDLEELGRLYRHTVSDLAVARRDFPGDRATRYLEQLAARAHPMVYRRQSAGWGRAREFFVGGFPRAFREAGPYTAIAFALMAIPLTAAFVASLIDPVAGRIILPSAPMADQIERGESWMDIDSILRPFMASAIMTNNIQVAIFAFAGGILAGLGTVYVLASNGLMLGAVSGLATKFGLGPTLGSFVAAHGGIELTVIFIAGGAGLRLGHALLAPGLLSRPAALGAAAQKAVQLLFGCIPLLMVAGTLEGFVSPSSLPIAAKAAIGVTATLLLYGYLLLAGRSRPTTEPGP